MSKKQTRRSISVRGSTYETVRSYCERQGLSMSEFIEERIAGFFGGTGQNERPQPTVPQAEEPKFVTSWTTPSQVGSPAKPAATVAPRRALASKRARTASKLDDQQLHDAARFFTF